MLVYALSDAVLRPRLCTSCCRGLRELNGLRKWVKESRGPDCGGGHWSEACLLLDVRLEHRARGHNVRCRIGQSGRENQQVRDLSNWTAAIHLDTFPLGSEGTPQGALLSPLLFNLAVVDTLKISRSCTFTTASMRASPLGLNGE